MAGRRNSTSKAGGSRKGDSNKSTIARHSEVVATGTTPLNYLLARMRDEEEVPAVRLEAAKAAAPYVHPKLAATEISGVLNFVSHEDALRELE